MKIRASLYEVEIKKRGQKMYSFSSTQIRFGKYIAHIMLKEVFEKSIKKGKRNCKSKKERKKSSWRRIDGLSKYPVENKKRLN